MLFRLGIESLSFEFLIDANSSEYNSKTFTPIVPGQGKPLEFASYLSGTPLLALKHHTEARIYKTNIDDDGTNLRSIYPPGSDTRVVVTPS